MADDRERASDLYPREPIDKLLKPLEQFLHVETASGIVLLLCTALALILANSGLSEWFLGIWKTEVGFEIGGFSMSHSLKHWINDGLMAIFFFVIGLEVKREMVLGELREMRRAALPILAALGGMIVPAAIYFAQQAGQPAQHGWGIPMATDIAFVVGCMAILGNRVPRGLRVLILSLAIADDIGAILVIAIGYTESIHLGALCMGIAGIGLIGILSRLGVRSILTYTVFGVLVWLAFHESGVHATIAGVIIGLITPARVKVDKGTFATILERAGEVFHGEWDTMEHRAQRLRKFQKVARDTIPPLEYLEGTLHPWVGFFIMPVFALANAGVAFKLSDFGSPIALAVMTGLVIGKPLGIGLFSFLSVKLGIARLPDGVGWGAVIGGGVLAGIGFTMALFIAGLALTSHGLDEAKVGILAGSLVSAVVGMLILLKCLPKPEPAPAE